MPVHNLRIALRAKIVRMRLRRKCYLPFTHSEKSVVGYTKLVKKLLRLKYKGGINCPQFISLYTKWLNLEVNTSLQWDYLQTLRDKFSSRKIEKGYALFNYKFGQKAPDEKLLC